MHPRALASQLLRENRGLIANTVLRLSTRLRPQLAVIEGSARSHHIERVLHQVEGILDGGDTSDHLLDVVKQVIELRALAGIEPVNYVGVAHCYSAAIRRVFHAKAPNIPEAAAAYDEVEIALLPVFSRFGDVLFAVRSDDEFTDPASPWFQEMLSANASGGDA